MPELKSFLAFTDRLTAANIQYMVTGSVAGMIYGEPRLTHAVNPKPERPTQTLCTLHKLSARYTNPLQLCKSFRLEAPHRNDGGCPSLICFRASGE